MLKHKVLMKVQRNSKKAIKLHITPQILTRNRKDHRLKQIWEPREGLKLRYSISSTSIVNNEGFSDFLEEN